MSLDLTGVTVANLIVNALQLPQPPTNPTPAQQTAYETALAAQVLTWTIIMNQLLTYLKNNASISSNTYSTLGVADGYAQGTIS